MSSFANLAPPPSSFRRMSPNPIFPRKFRLQADYFRASRHFHSLSPFFCSWLLPACFFEFLRSTKPSFLRSNWNSDFSLFIAIHSHNVPRGMRSQIEKCFSKPHFWLWLSACLSNGKLNRARTKGTLKSFHMACTRYEVWKPLQMGSTERQYSLLNTFE